MSLLLDEPAASERVLAPQAPASFDDIGLSAETVSALVVKWLDRGEATGLQLARSLCLPYGILEPLIERLRTEQLVEVKRASGIGTAGYALALTDSGRDRARRLMQICSYVGPAPVPVAQYIAFMTVLGAERPLIDADRVAKGFSHLIVAPEMLDQLGPAINARRALFLYGAPGNGKSVMGDGIGRALGGNIYVPTAIDVDGEIITVFDPVTHVPTGAADEGIIVRADDEVDARWIRVRRPVLTVGGELTLEMLDLRFNAIAGFYDAPLQLKANGGVLVVDDFGRQRVPAKDLLNRWVVPLESRVDYLGLHTGRKFQVPFDVMVVFATNLDPASLADEAFLRRIPYKVLAKDPTLEQFSRIFAMNCQRHAVEFDQAHVDHLFSRYYVGRKIPMRACHPRDLLDQIAAMCRYRNRPVEVSAELLDAACATYFVQ